ncbi:hypothetical protein ACJ73_06239 [Blastomyces percursus]|uniref:Uncharacterized protein n=1 Tax=Blastomyces percursus TaxID=1658174 RepID=A0A1J9R468_9EURO|nr:hypothetical protein ACJ73_06239 [Blastomyces percursus]
MDSDRTLPKSNASGLGTRRHDSRGEERQLSYLQLKKAVEDALRRFEDVEDNLAKKWNDLVDFATFIDKKGLKTTEDEFKEVHRGFGLELPNIIYQGIADLSTLKQIQEMQGDTSITTAVLESLQKDIYHCEKRYEQYQKDLRGLREDFNEYKKDHKEEL